MRIGRTAGEFRAMTLACGAIGLVAVFGCVLFPPPDEECPEFTYEGEEGPEFWGSLCPEYALCDAGEEQSPIDLPGNAADDPDLSGVTFAYAAQQYTVVNTGETIRVDAPDGNSITLDGVAYELVQFHYHMPSEHTVDGAPSDMEMHLVHQATDGSLAVVGLFIVEGEENAVLAPIFAALPPERDDMVELGETIDLTGALPADRGVFRYDGSLTTPPCSEGLKWNVLATPIELSAEQIGAFDELYDFENARPVQPLNGRVVSLVE